MSTKRRDQLAEWRALSLPDLATAITREEAALVTRRFDLANGKLKSPSAIRSSRTSIARLHTLMHERVQQEVERTSSKEST